MLAFYITICFRLYTLFELELFAIATNRARAPITGKNVADKTQYNETMVWQNWVLKNSVNWKNEGFTAKLFKTTCEAFLAQICLG